MVALATLPEQVCGPGSQTCPQPELPVEFSGVTRHAPLRSSYVGRTNGSTSARDPYGVTQPQRGPRLHYTLDSLRYSFATAFDVTAQGVVSSGTLRGSLVLNNSTLNAIPTIEHMRPPVTVEPLEAQMPPVAVQSPTRRFAEIGRRCLPGDQGRLSEAD